MTLLKNETAVTHPPKNWDKSVSTSTLTIIITVLLSFCVSVLLTYAV